MDVGVEAGDGPRWCFSQSDCETAREKGQETDASEGREEHQRATTDACVAICSQRGRVSPWDAVTVMQE